jgi:hypothetical protein
MNRRASTRVARGPVRAVLAVEALAAMVSARAAHADDCHATSSLTPRLEGRSGTGLLAGVCADVPYATPVGCLRASFPGGSREELVSGLSD